jgi:hypothetical protein
MNRVNAPTVDDATARDATMPFDDLERAYEMLAQAIDRAGPEHEALFLTRLALVLAHRVGRLAVFEQAVEDASIVTKSNEPSTLT